MSQMARYYDQPETEVGPAEAAPPLRVLLDGILSKASTAHDILDGLECGLLGPRPIAVGPRDDTKEAMHPGARHVAERVNFELRRLLDRLSDLNNSI